jgi:hypothetical protein
LSIGGFKDYASLVTLVRAIKIFVYRWRIARIGRRLTELQRQRSAMDATKVDPRYLEREYEALAITLAILSHSIAMHPSRGDARWETEKHGRAGERLSPSFADQTAWIAVAATLVLFAFIAFAAVSPHASKSAEQWLKEERSGCEKARNKLVQAQVKNDNLSGYGLAVREACAGLDSSSPGERSPRQKGQH